MKKKFIYSHRHRVWWFMYENHFLKNIWKTIKYIYIYFFSSYWYHGNQKQHSRIWIEPPIAIKLKIWAPIFSFYWNREFSNAHVMNIIKYQAIYLISMQTLGNRIHMDRLNGFARLMIVSDLVSTMVDFLLICL